MDINTFYNIQRSIIKYTKNNQGCDYTAMIDNLSDLYTEVSIKYVLDIWEKNWNTFFQNWGRIVSHKNKWFYLDNKHPLSRDNKTKIIKFFYGSI